MDMVSVRVSEYVLDSVLDSVPLSIELSFDPSESALRSKHIHNIHNSNCYLVYLKLYTYYTYKATCRLTWYGWKGYNGVRIYGFDTYGCTSTLGPSAFREVYATIQGHGGTCVISYLFFGP